MGQDVSVCSAPKPLIRPLQRSAAIGTASPGRCVATAHRKLNERFNCFWFKWCKKRSNRAPKRRPILRYTLTGYDTMICSLFGQSVTRVISIFVPRKQGTHSLNQRLKAQIMYFPMPWGASGQRHHALKSHTPREGESRCLGTPVKPCRHRCNSLQERPVARKVACVRVCDGGS